MNFVPVITHAVAILLGWLVVSFATLPDPVETRAESDPAGPPARNFRSGSSDHRPSPRSLLAAQANMPMDPAARTALKGRILMEWANTDPDGLLRYLHQRPWLGGFENAATKAFETMARTRPDDLLDYAKREGCLLAIGTLCRHGDPRLVLDLLLALPPGVFSSEIFDDVLAEVFERGCDLDPTFHERLNAIEDPGTRLKVFKKAARTLLGAMRDDEFYPWIAKHVDTLPSESVAWIVARQLVAGRSDVNDLNRLPDSIRSHAIDSALRSLVSARIYSDESYQRTCFTSFLKNGWLDGRQDLAAVVITEYYEGVPDAKLRRTAAAGWKTWALDLPKNPKWDPLRRTAIRRWILETPDAWNAIANLPTKDLRNTAYTAVLHKIDLERDVDRVPWILHQITDPALRNIALEVITERMAGDPDVPSAAADIDPFNPLGER